MTIQRKLLIGAGAAVIVLMLLIACFSLGVFVGARGRSGDGLSIQQPGGQGVPQNGQNGQGLQQPVPGGGRTPDLLGRVRQVLSDGLLLATTDGPRTVAFDSETRLQGLDGQGGSMEDLEPGLIVAVFGTRVNGGNVLLADLIVIVSEPPQQQAPP